MGANTGKAGRTERQLQNECIRHMKAMRESGQEIFWVRIPAGPMQRKGIPNLIVVYRGLVIWVKFRAPTCIPTTSQLYVGVQLRQAGGEWFVVQESDVFSDLLEHL